MSRVDPKYKEKFAAITSKTYAAQAKWFLNGFWNNGIDKEAENIWKFAQKFIELDQKKGHGNDLDEFFSHKFLESLGETLTVIALRERLRQIDIDNNNRMALIEYLMFKYSKSVEQVVNAPQSDNKEELEAASRKVEAAQNALVEMQARLSEQKVALEAQKKAESEAKKAEEENKAALAELHKQEEDYKNRIAALEKATQEGTVVQKNKAANELAQLKGEDPLPLLKAKITQESAVRKAEKTRKAAEEATAKTEEKTREVEAATREAEKKFEEAQNYLEEVKAKGGSSAGDIWWMTRELTEAKKYLPKSKQ